MGKRMWMLVVAACMLVPVALAGTGNLQFVETDVILYPNGQTSVKYVVRYRVRSGEFHGFYFSGLVPAGRREALLRYGGWAIAHLPFVFLF